MAQEKNFENRIKDFLKENDCWYVKYFANRMTKSGIPDILACVDRYFVAIEIKAKSGKPSELQKYHVREINNTGGIAIVLYPDQFEDFKDIVYFLKRGMGQQARLIVKNINKRSEI